MKELGGVLGDRLERERLRIEGGWPEFGVDFDGTALPQEIDRDAKSDFVYKGMLFGAGDDQRLDALGQVQKKLLRLRIPNSCEVGLSAKIYVGEQRQDGSLRRPIRNRKTMSFCSASLNGVSHGRRPHFPLTVTLPLFFDE